MSHFRSLTVVASLCLSAGLAGCSKKAEFVNVPPEQHAIAAEIAAVGGLYETTPEQGIIQVTLNSITKVDDAFIGKLVEALPNLEGIDMDDTSITDASVAHLKKLKNLKAISVATRKTKKVVDTQDSDDGGKINIVTEVPIPLLSPAAVDALRKQFPDLVIGGVEMPENSENT